MTSTKSRAAATHVVVSCALLLLSPAARGAPLPITTLHSTGFDQNGQRIFAGADPHYTLLRVDSTAYWDGTIVQPPTVGPNYVVFDPPVNPQVVQYPLTWAWVQNTDASSWLSLEGSVGWSQYWTGIYTYQTTFDLTGLDPATVRISGIWGTDDPGWIYVNLDDPTVFDPARLVVAGGGFSALPAYEITGASGLFKPGLNTLTFIVWDGGNYVTGLRFQVDSATAEPAIREVTVDVKPGSWPNAINLASDGVLPVAILSTPDFDATTVAVDTLTVASAGVAVRKAGTFMAAAEDVNLDGLLDLAFKVVTADLGIGPDTTELVVHGFTSSGQEIRGSDAVVIVPQ